MGYHDPNRLKPVSALDPQAGEPGLGAHPLGVQLLQRARHWLNSARSPCSSAAPHQVSALPAELTMPYYSI